MMKTFFRSGRESDLVPKADMELLIQEVMNNGYVIRHVEGFVVEKNYDVAQNDLLFRYTPDESSGKDHSVESAEFLKKCLADADDVRPLHFKVFIDD